MILYPLLHRPRLLRANFVRVMHGFSLLEVVLVLFVLGLLATALAPSVRDIIERGRREAEARSLDELTANITASFEQADLTNLNLAALPGTIGPGDTATVFSTSTSAGYAITNTTDWFAKLGRMRGVTPQIGAAPTPTIQPELARIAFNGLGNPRLLIAGPTESGRQRFLLVSLMARSDQLVLPAYESGAAWFEALWQNDWDSRTAVPPTYWSGRLTLAQLAAWSAGSAGMTQVSRLGVRRIVLPKFRLTINNNHPSEAAFATFNNTPNAFSAPANSGANVSPEILGGRLIIINRGAAWPGVEALRFALRENPTITLQ
ncbi:MAG: prepilin-type N-terminal cleavage/methylation domain-containing protein [Opitutaceae bacterium]|nr:prepilin-type N-terminal cleavage/methylation domain-containing protein [Opitutaceae bacterium]